MTSPRNLKDLDKPVVDGAPDACADCSAPLCLRKQVLNLALGNTDEMWCLNCLARDNEQTPQDVLEGLIDYVFSRDCFRKEWLRYVSVQHCPDRAGCLPDTCFKRAK
jgi:hypothetical protein